VWCGIWRRKAKKGPQEIAFEKGSLRAIRAHLIVDYPSVQTLSSGYSPSPYRSFIEISQQIEHIKMDAGQSNFFSNLIYPLGVLVIFGILGWIFKALADKREMAKVYGWLKDNSTEDGVNKFRSTRAIASHNNLSEQRVREICSKCPKIYQSTGSDPDMWSIHGRAPKKVSPRIRKL
jgi:hypothetical protein